MSGGATDRKLTTNFAADVVGYSRMMAVEEEITLRTLKDYRLVIDALIDKHGGRIFNTAGDAVMAEFDSAVEAVRSAISILEELAVRNGSKAEDRQMWFRIGIHVGDVIVEGKDLFGDGVNVASRLEGLAETGGICISGTTFEQVKNKLSVSFADLGPQSVKNIPDPVPAFRLKVGNVSLQGPAKKRGFRKIALWLAVAMGAAVAVFYFAQFALQENSQNQFDGMWKAEVLNRTGCKSNEPTSYTFEVRNGKIEEPSQRLPKTGTMAADGKFRIEVTTPDGRPMNVQEGEITKNGGKGTLIGAREGCSGQVILKKIP